MDHKEPGWMDEAIGFAAAEEARHEYMLWAKACLDLYRRLGPVQAVFTPYIEEIKQHGLRLGDILWPGE